MLLEVRGGAEGQRLVLPQSVTSSQVCKNPRNPGFNHYLFESVAALIRHAGGSSPGGIDAFENLLFPAFEHVLQQDVQVGVLRKARSLETFLKRV
jgi:hypothetical protein